MAQHHAESAIWAVNAVHFATLPDRQGFERVKTYLGGTLEHLWPIFICGPDHCKDWRENSEAQQTLQFMRSLNVHELQTLFSPKEAAEEKGKLLREEAKKRKVDFIVLTTQKHLHFRDLWGKSFVEEMLGSCSIPLLFLPRQNLEGQASKAFFSSDFSEHSRKSYRRFLQQMGNYLEEIVLFHALSLPIETLSASAYSGVPASFSDQELIEQEKQIKKACEDWIEEARLLYPQISVRSRVEPVTQSLEKTLLDVVKEEGVGLIGLASQSGPVAGMFLGSVSRNILENAPCPVWTCGLQLMD